jgi:ribonucleases P/MRP protein subunit RPP40
VYADDCKFYRTIQDDENMKLLQHDISRFSQWCQDNELNVNASKCSYISFTRRKGEATRNYEMEMVKLDSVTSVRDSGVDLSVKMDFSPHINRVKSSAMRVLGFIRRFSNDFKDLSVLKLLYYALVRPHLEYCSIVWSPYTADDIARIESVQRKFTKFACKKMIPQRDLSYEDRCKYLNLDLLTKRRERAGQVFVAAVLDSSINSSELLARLQIQVPRRNSRATTILKETGKHKIDYGKNNPLARIKRNFNGVQDTYDYHLTEEKIKNLLK